eukprot:gene9184-6461_t
MSLGADGEAAPSAFANRKIKVSWTRVDKEMCETICLALVDRDAMVPIKVVDLLDNQLGPYQTQKIASCLESSPVCDVLICYNDIGRDGCDGVAGVVNVSSKLQHLDLRGNHLSPADVRKLLKAVAGSTSLKRLGLAHNKLGPDGAALLSKALERNTYLTVLDISMNEIGAAGAECIAAVLANPSSCLKNVQVYGNHLGLAGVRHIVKSLQHNKEVRILNIGNNNATDAVCGDVGDLLDTNCTIEELDMRLNSISADGIKEMSRRGLLKNSTLRKMILSGNPIGPVGAEEVAKALTTRGRSFFQCLDVSSCELGPIGGIRIAGLIACSISLKEIYLSDNNLDDDAAISIARSAAESISLSTIDLSLNNIGESGASCLIDTTQLNTHLASVVLHGNNINRVVQKEDRQFARGTHQSQSGAEGLCGAVSSQLSAGR